jgi:DNA-binding transcriptional MerR regulator
VQQVKQADRPGRPIYSISAVSRMLGVPAATLRTWEERYKLVVPERNASGHRLYSRDQVEQLEFVKTRMAGGVSAADAHRLLAELGEESFLGSLPHGPHTRLLILVAERDPFSAEYEEYFLRTEGFVVDVTLSEGAARDSFRERSPSLVIVDLMISGGTGLDLVRFFKKRAEVPVIAMSVLTWQDQALEAGADVFLPKPVESLRLVSAVRDLLGSSAFLTRQGMVR